MTGPLARRRERFAAFGGVSDCRSFPNFGSRVFVCRPRKVPRNASVKVSRVGLAIAATRSLLKSHVRKVREAIAAADVAAATEAIRVTTKKLDQAAARDVIHANASARLKSRLSAAIKAAKDQDRRLVRPGILVGGGERLGATGRSRITRGTLPRCRAYLLGDSAIAFHSRRGHDRRAGRCHGVRYFKHHTHLPGFFLCRRPTRGSPSTPARSIRSRSATSTSSSAQPAGRSADRRHRRERRQGSALYAAKSARNWCGRPRSAFPNVEVQEFSAWRFTSSAVAVRGS